jgi:hypothetical protein
VKPRHRVLGIVAVVLVLAAIAGLVATAMGWAPIGPPALPQTAYAPREGAPTDYDGTLDHGNFTVHGTTYAAELAGPSQVSNGAGYKVAIHRVSGSGGRIALASLNLTDVTTNRSVVVGADEIQNGILSSLASLELGAGNHTLRAEAVVLTYREAWIGVWPSDPVVLRFEALVEARP